jgi:hypothetical protein
MASESNSPSVAVSRESVPWGPPQFIELDEERREQIVQLLVELLDQSPDEPAIAVDGDGVDEGDAA